MAIQIGCFMDLYNMITNKDRQCDSGSIVAKFICYYCHFDGKESINSSDDDCGLQSTLTLSVTASQELKIYWG